MERTHSDVVIIGGGIIGFSAAYFLSRRGATVTVLEQAPFGTGASFGNAGLVVPSHFVPLAAPGVIAQGLRWMLNPASPFYIKPRLNVDLMRWLFHFRSACTRGHVERTMGILRDLHLASQRLYDSLAHAWTADFEYQRRGLLMLFRTEEGRHSCVHEAELADTLGVEARLVTTAGLRDLEPAVGFRARGAVYFPGDAHLSPAKFMHALRQETVNAGVTFIPSAPAQGFDVSGRTIKGITTPTGTVIGDSFVLAGGSWSANIARSLGIHIPLQPGKGYSITLPLPSARPSIPMILTEARVAVTPFAEGIRFAGTMELAGLDHTINPRRVQAILNAVPQYLSLDQKLALDSTSLQHQVWAGLRPCSPDGLPYIGRFSRYANLIAATGHAMIGISLAPITGQLVAEIVQGEKPSLPLELLSPDRY